MPISSVPAPTLGAMVGPLTGVAQDIMMLLDAVIHFDGTPAAEPLDRNAGWDLGQPPDTYPSGL